MERKYRLIAPLGLNARVASLIVGVFNRFANNTITVHYNGEQADGKSILSLITLVVKSGEEITVEVDGNNSENVFTLLYRKFCRTQRRTSCVLGRGYFSTSARRSNASQATR